MLRRARHISPGRTDRGGATAKTGALYDEDFVRWTEVQAEGLRRAASQRSDLPLDWDNLAEEVASLGRSQRRELRSRIAVIIEHLLKLAHSPSAEPRSGWIETVGRERREVERLLEDSPSLRGEIDRLVALEGPRTAAFVAEATRSFAGEQAAFTEEQVLGDWFPHSRPQGVLSEAKRTNIGVILRHPDTCLNGRVSHLWRTLGVTQRPHPPFTPASAMVENAGV